MISGRIPMILIIIVPIVTESGGRKSRCSQSYARMISDLYTYRLYTNGAHPAENESLAEFMADSAENFLDKQPTF
jgi:hypothetical protein